MRLLKKKKLCMFGVRVLNYFDKGNAFDKKKFIKIKFNDL